MNLLLRHSLLRSPAIQRLASHQWQLSDTTCQSCQRRSLHTSPVVMDSLMKNTKKKNILEKKKIAWKPKSLKRQRKVVPIHVNMTVKDIAAAADITFDDVFSSLLYLDRNAHKYKHPDAVIPDIELIKQTLEKCGFRWKLEIPKVRADVSKDIPPRPPPDPASLVKRPPVVAIMGHIDHGKTTLLDSLRKSTIVEQEFGGITQHIGAFAVTLETGDKITFFDTPGHAAFHKMRSRGASVTDIVILVVAADDGAMAQTAESIRFAEAAGAAIIVAINKIDRPNADVEGTKTTLLQYGIVTEEQGGDVQAVPISALKGTNLKDLNEAIVTLAEVLDLRGDPTGGVEATVIESRLHPNKGKLCTMLVQRGTLKKGAFLVADSVYGKVRSMYNDRGATVTTVGPGYAVEVGGWKELPSAGDFIQQVKSEKQAQEVVHYRKRLEMKDKAMEDQRHYEASMESHWENYRSFMMNKGHRVHFRRSTFCKITRTKEVQETNTGPSLSILIKGDVDGSVEAILDALSTYQSDQCTLDILNFGCGAVTEEDVQMAANFSGVVYTFNTTVPETVKAMAEKLDVNIANHNVIYKLVDDLKERLQEKLPLLTVEEELGEAQVLELFLINVGKKKVPVAGCRCVSGSLNKKHLFKLVRNEQVLYQGELESMRHLKKEVQSIKKEMECGLQFSDTDIMPEPNDQVICYQLKEVEQTLDWDTQF